MVIGNGLIARAFAGYQADDQYLFFCSGVSNSMCQDPAEFEREKDLLSKSIIEHPEKTLIYFSTCSIIDPSMRNSMYVKHKLALEYHIQSLAKQYYIFRLSNVVGHTANKSTILNFLFNAVKSGHSFQLWQNSTRNLIDVDHTALIVRAAIESGIGKQTIINIANPNSYDVLYIVSEIEQFLGTKAAYELVEKGEQFRIPIPEIEPVIKVLRIDFDHGYLRQLLTKYYPR